MTKEKAIDLLDNLLGMVEDSQENDYDDAIKMAINCLKMSEHNYNNCMNYTCKSICRADAIDSIISKIDDEYYDGGYGDYHEVAMIVRMLEQLKEQKNG